MTLWTLDPADPLPTAVVSMVVDNEQEFNVALNTMLDSAEADGMSKEGLGNAREMLSEFCEAFRVKRGNDPPANILPLVE
jgi:hypothetical protein